MSKVAHKIWFSAITLAVLAGLLSALWAVKFAGRPGGVFPLRHLAIHSEFQHQSAEQIRAAILPQLRRGFFGINLLETHSILSAMPWAAKVEVRKRWPDLVVVQVQERRAVATWGAMHLIDENGAVFEVTGAELIAGLPKLSGPEARREELLKFVTSTHKDLANLGLALAEARLSERGGLVLGLNSGVKVIVGRQNFAERWARLIDSLPTLLSRGQKQRLIEVDLRYTNGMAARFETPSQPAPVAPLSPADQRSVLAGAAPLLGM